MNIDYKQNTLISPERRNSCKMSKSKVFGQKLDI